MLFLTPAASLRRWHCPCAISQALSISTYCRVRHALCHLSVSPQNAVLIIKEDVASVMLPLHLLQISPAGVGGFSSKCGRLRGRK